MMEKKSNDHVQSLLKKFNSQDKGIGSLLIEKTIGRLIENEIIAGCTLRENIHE